MEHLIGELCCPVCLELYTMPIILPCSHVLCRAPCAERLFVQDFIRCPVCRDNCFITGGIDNLPRVLTLERIIEQCNQPSITAPTGPIVDPSDICGPGDIPCQLCQGEPVLRAVHSCLNCSASYCQKCLSLSHPDREPFNKHQLVKPKTYSPPREPRCPQHEGLVNVWCQTCQVLGCLFCADDPQTHQGHKMLSIDQAAIMFKEKLEGDLKKLVVDQNMVNMAIGRGQHRLESFLESVESRRNEINQQCDNLIAEVENKRSFFLSDLQYEERSKRDTLTGITNGYQDQKDYLLSVTHYVQEVLKEKDKRAMIQLAKLAHDKAAKHLLTQGDRQMDSSQSLTLCNKLVDLRKERAILRDMTYLRVPDQPVIIAEKCLRSVHSVVLVLDTARLEYDVIDGYRVCYSKDARLPLQQWDVLEFTTPHEERKYGREPPSNNAVCLIHDNLESGVTYWFCMKAYNAAGESDISENVSCQTLSESQSLLPVPEIAESICHTYTYAIQIHSPSPQDGTTGISHFLLYREARHNQIWKTIPLYGRVDHRVFGLESNMLYDFIIMACNASGECRVSNGVSLRTERAAY